jgi:PAS domain-containing protein
LFWSPSWARTTGTRRKGNGSKDRKPGELWPPPCATSEAGIEAVTDAVSLEDTRGRSVMIRTAGARLLGRSVEEVIGKDDTDQFAPDTARQIIEADREIIPEG